MPEKFCCYSFQFYSALFAPLIITLCALVFAALLHGVVLPAGPVVSLLTGSASSLFTSCSCVSLLVMCFVRVALGISQKQPKVAVTYQIYPRLIYMLNKHILKSNIFPTSE